MNAERFAGVVVFLGIALMMLFFGKTFEADMLETRIQFKEAEIRALESRIAALEETLAIIQTEKDHVEQENAELRRYINALQPLAAQIVYHNPTLGDQAMRVAAQVYQSSHRYGVDPWLVIALGSAESDWRLNVRGRDGEYGPLQVMPATFRLLGGDNPSDWRETLDAGVRYLAMSLEKAGGNERLALAYYNSGINRSPRSASNISGSYATKVLARRRG